MPPSSRAIEKEAVPLGALRLMVATQLSLTFRQLQEPTNPVGLWCSASLALATLFALASGSAAQGLEAGRQAERVQSAAQASVKSTPHPTDWYGDPLPAGAIARLGTERLRFGQFPRASLCLPDDKTILAMDVVTGETPGTAVVSWDLRTGKRLQRTAGPALAIRKSAFSVTNLDRQHMKQEK